MLQGVSPLLTGEILQILDAMGHSDSVVLADANFPAHRTNATVVEVPGIGITEMLKAVLTVFPLDEDHPPVLMDSKLEDHPSAQVEILEVLRGSDHRMVDRWDYYDFAKEATAVISTGEMRTWANVLLYKGLVLG